MKIWKECFIDGPFQSLYFFVYQKSKMATTLGHIPQGSIFNYHSRTYYRVELQHTKLMET